METLENHQLQQLKTPITIFGYHILQQPNKHIATRRNSRKKTYKQQGYEFEVQAAPAPWLHHLRAHLREEPKGGGNMTLELVGT